MMYKFDNLAQMRAYHFVKILFFMFTFAEKYKSIL